MATQLFNGPICQVRNWFADINTDGTMARTAGEPPGPVNTYSSVPAHHTHHSYHGHHSHVVQRHNSKPVRMMIFDPKKVVRLLNAVAVLKARRDKLVLAWETYDEQRDQNKKTIPDHSGRPEWLKGVFFGSTTVETGDIYEVLGIAKRLTDEWMAEFVAVCGADAKEAWFYLVAKRDEGHRHLESMAKIYSQAAAANLHSRQSADMFGRVAKTTKLSCDVLVNVIGALLPHEQAMAGIGIESGYILLTSDSIWDHAWGAGEDPDLVGVSKEKGEELLTMDGKEVLAVIAHAIEHAMGKKAKEVMLKELGMAGSEYAKALDAFRKLVAKNSEVIWNDFLKTNTIYAKSVRGMISQGEVLAAREAKYKGAVALAKRGTTAGKALGHAFSAARWLYIAHEVKEKLHNIQEVWEAPIEDEERIGKSRGATAAHE